MLAGGGGGGGGGGGASGSAPASAVRDPHAAALSAFNKECLRMGCLKGFLYFDTYLRGREELMIVVRNPSTVARSTSAPPGTPGARAGAQPPSYASLFREQLGREQLQQQFSPLLGGVPPASPVARESFGDAGAGDVVFLLASYARYKRPYVWLRSPNAGRLKNPTATDAPIRLVTTERWPGKPRDTHAWDVIAELVRSCNSAASANPFVVDRAALMNMQIGSTETLICAAAMASMLAELVRLGVKACIDDLRFVCELHYHQLPRALRAAQEQQQAQQQQQQQQQQLQPLSPSGSASGADWRAHQQPYGAPTLQLPGRGW